MVKLGRDFVFQIFGLCEEIEPPQASDSDEDDDGSVSDADLLAHDFNNIKNNTASWFGAFLNVMREEYVHKEAPTNVLLDFLDEIEDKINEMQPRIKRARKTLQGREEEGEEESGDDMEEGPPEETLEG